jgi:ATP-dependent protease ClpP protease subunit
MSYAREYTSFDPYGGLTDEEEESSADAPFWLRHWRGQLPLARSYWVNGFLVNIVTVAGQAFILGLAQSRQLALVASAFVIFVALALALQVWSFVGIWRSAGRHVARGGSAFWAFAARAMIALGVISLAATSPQLWSQTREMVLIASGNDPIGTPAVIETSASGDEITFDGNITSGVSANLRQVLDAAPKARKLLLKSRGGRILEALAMVDLIKARRLDTRVVQNCESACTLLFLAGVERSASPLAAIGFHQPDFPGLSSQERASIIQSNREDYRAAGITDQFIDRIMATTPEQMWYPTGEEMTNAGVLNAVVVSGHRSDRELSRLNEVLGQAVKAINSSRGTMVDSITQLKGAQLNGQVIDVDYAITKPLQLSGSRLASAMTPQLRKNMCSGPDGALISSGGKYRFNYRYKDGRNIGTVVIDHC